MAAKYQPTTHNLFFYNNTYFFNMLRAQKIQNYEKLQKMQNFKSQPL